MKAHAITEVFPLIDGPEYRALVDDIREHGLREPIVRLDGAILDGRNRWFACSEAGVAPRYVDYEGDDPLAYVVSMNLTRRHLSEEQRALVAAKIEGFKHGGDRSKLPIGILKRATAAEMLNVSERSVARARNVLDLGTKELRRSVETGKVSLHAASAISHLTPDEQRRILTKGDDEILKAAAEINDRRRAIRKIERERLEEEMGLIQERKRAERAGTMPPWEFIGWDGTQRLVSTYEDMVDVFIARRHQLGWSQAELDQRAGFQEGYTAKLELWQGKGGRTAGNVTLPLWMDTLGLTMLPVVVVPGTIAEQRAHLESITRPPLEDEVAHRRRTA